MTAKELLNQATQYIANKDIENAKKMYEKIIEEFPKSKEAITATFDLQDLKDKEKPQAISQHNFNKTAKDNKNPIGKSNIMLKTIGITIGTIVIVLAISNPSEDSLKFKIEEKTYDAKTTVFSNTNIGRVDRKNFLIFSVANVKTMSNIGGMGMLLSSSSGERKFIGILGNWFQVKP